MSTDLQLYVVKVRRNYAGYEATSVLHGPVSRADAEANLAKLIDTYQDPDAYYLEQWDSTRREDWTSRTVMEHFLKQVTVGNSE